MGWALRWQASRPSHRPHRVGLTKHSPRALAHGAEIEAHRLNLLSSKLHHALKRVRLLLLQGFLQRVASFPLSFCPITGTKRLQIQIYYEDRRHSASDSRASSSATIAARALESNVEDDNSMVDQPEACVRNLERDISRFAKLFKSHLSVLSLLAITRREKRAPAQQIRKSVYKILRIM